MSGAQIISGILGRRIRAGAFPERRPPPAASIAGEASPFHPGAEA